LNSSNFNQLSKMNPLAKQLRIVTLANLIVSVLLLRAVHLPRLAFDLQFSGKSLWAFFLLAPTGIALSITGLRFARRTQAAVSRGVGYFVNVSALAITGGIVLATFYLFLGTTEERFIIPDGYRGTVRIFYGVKGGERPDRSFKSLTLTIPYDGVLLVREPMFTGLTQTMYFYARPNGILQQLSGSWPDGSLQISDTLRGDNEVGVSFRRAGGITTQGCTAEFEQFSVGAKAELEAQHEDDEELPAYLRSHPEVCIHPSKPSPR
jgi:hypothetical protein